MSAVAAAVASCVVALGVHHVMMLGVRGCVGKFVGESSVLGKLRIAAEFAGIRLSACVVVECLKRITITIVLVTIIIFVVAIRIRDSPGPEHGPLPALGTLERGKRAKMSG